MLQMTDVACPYCGETVSLALDASAGGQQYIEDCHVCCRPMTVQLVVDAEGGAVAHVQAEHDA